MTLSSLKSFSKTLALIVFASHTMVVSMHASISTTLNMGKPLSFALILDGKPDFVMAGDFNRIINQKCTTLTSSPILHHPDAHFEKLKDASTWRVFCDHAKYFVLCIPADDIRSLSEMGFNESEWSTQIASADLDNLLMGPDTENKPIDEQWIANFDRLWLKPGTEKYLYLVGHGLTDYSIAGIPLQHYPAFLNILAHLNTKFVWISSCYLGGANLLTMQKNLTKDIGKPPFIVIAESVGEITAVALSTVQYKKMFDTVVAFFAQPRPPFMLEKPFKRPHRHL